MTTVKKALNHWLDIMADAVRELAGTSLGVADQEVVLLPETENPGEGSTGAFLALVSDDESIQVGMVSDGAGCRTLSAAFLGMEPEEAVELTGGDIADSMGEMINIVAGMLKVRMAKDQASMNLGLPIYLGGQIEATPQQEVGVWGLRIRDVDVQIIVVRQRDS